MSRFTIDRKVEDPLRYAFGHAIDKDPEGAWRRLESLDDQQIGLAFLYAWYVVGYVMHDVFGDDTVGGSEIIADHVIADVNPWLDLGTKEEVEAFIRACISGELAAQAPDDVNQDRVAEHSIVVASYLLARYRPEGQKWFEYLDQIWNFAEQQPAP